MKYLLSSEYTFIDNPRPSKDGLIFVGYKNSILRNNKRSINTSSRHKEENRIYSTEGILPTILSRSRNSFILINF